MGGLMLLGSVAAIAAMAVLRVSWGLPQRSAPLNALGWLLMALSVVLGWTGAGAWGVTVVSLWAIGAAMVLVGFAAWRSPPARRKPVKRRVGMLPEHGEPLHLGRRVATFLIVVPAALLASLALGLATRWIALLAGASEANANVLALFAVPVGWTLLAFLILMTTERRRQFALLAVTGTTALPAIVAGQLL